MAEAAVTAGHQGQSDESRGRQGESSLTPWLLLAPGTIWIALFVGIPMVSIIIFGFWKSGFAGLQPAFSFTNYAQILGRPTFWKITLWTYAIVVMTLAGVIVLQGNPTDAALLREENVGEMHAFIATGRVEEVNVMSALLAQRLGARRVIATVNRVDYLPLAKAMGVDVCISPRMTAVSSILHFIRRGRVVASRALGEEESAEAIEFEAQMTSEVVDTPLRELRLPKGALIACILRGDEVIVPTGDAIIQAGDHVVIVASKQAIGKVERMLARRQDQA